MRRVRGDRHHTRHDNDVLRGLPQAGPQCTKKQVQEEREGEEEGRVRSNRPDLHLRLKGTDRDVPELQEDNVQFRNVLATENAEENEG